PGSREYGNSVLKSVNKSTSQFKKSVIRRSGPSAEEIMEKAKLHATEAFEYARVIGIMMYDKPDCPSQQYEVESSAKTGGRPTHKVTASFRLLLRLIWRLLLQSTDSDVNSEAEQQLGDCNNEETNNFNNTFRKASFHLISTLLIEVQEAKEAGRKVTSVKPVVQDVQGQLNTTALESASDLGSILVKNVSRLEKEILEAKKSNRCIDSSEGSCKDATDDAQASTEESESHKGQSEVLSDSNVNINCYISGSGEEINCVEACTDSSQDKENRILSSHKLPPLGAKGNHGGKRLSRIEAAKLEALRSFCTKDSSELNVGLDKVFVKATNRLEMEKRKALEEEQTDVQKQKDPQKCCDNTTASLDEILVKRVTRLEREKMEYEKRNASGEGQNIVSRDQRKYGNIATASESLDQVLVKRVSRLEREKMEYEKRNASGGARTGAQTEQEKHGSNDKASDSLDQILVKHVSRLEKEKMEHEKKGDGDALLLKKSDDTQCEGGAAGGLADILVKHPTKLEQAKQAAAAEANSTRVLNRAEERRRRERRSFWMHGEERAWELGETPSVQDRE
ncbi:hypothetical protein ZWY2020_005893, partial [Hordeum vulgare]